MKVMMTRHVDGVRQQMFHDSTNAVKKSLKKLVKDIEDFLLGKADEVFISVKRDYESVVLGRHAATQQLPREQRQIRSEVNSIIDGTELVFKKVVGLEPETPEPSVENPEEKETSPTAEDVRQDTVMEASETSGGSDDVATGILVADEKDGHEGGVAETSAQATAEQNTKESRSASEESERSTTPAHNPEIQITQNVHQSAGPPFCEEHVSLSVERTEPLTDASGRLNIPATADEGTISHDESGKENEVLKATSMSENDMDYAADGKLVGSSPRHERSSSVASWVQSWFSPRD